MDARWRLCAWAACVVGSLGSGALVLAAPQTATRALRVAADADELTVAALTARVGDDAVLSALGDDRDAWLRLAAIHASPYVHDPAQTLVSLSAIAGGRDPDLAPAAARRVLWIAQALALGDPSALELTPATIDPVRASLAALARADSARREIRLCAGQAQALLDQLRGSN
jgi:hypothetical protein